MMREANRGDKQEIFQLWKSCYPTQNEQYLKFYFTSIYDQGVSVIQEQDHRIVSSLQMNYHSISFMGKRLKMSYLLGASTLPDYRRRGHMHALMQTMLDEAEHICLLTFMKAFNPRAYAKYGFEVAYMRNSYTISRDELYKVSTARINNKVEASELFQLYQRFAFHFDGWYTRDTQYYSTLLKEMEMEQKNILVYRNTRGEVTGYIIYQRLKTEILVQEAIYLESAVLKRLLKKAIGVEKELTIMVSSSERLEKIFPLSIPKKQPFMMVRINNYELFNKLYNMNVKTVSEAYAKMKKPNWCHEYY